MNPLTIEWVRKAEGDFATARRELQVQTEANYDAVCYHAQQCAEKYLKARLREARVRFGRTHELELLLELALPLEPEWEVMRDDLALLATHAVAVRYPGADATFRTAAEAAHLCAAVRRRIRATLGLGVTETDGRELP
jgi:HEPN domain-containing protein